MCNSITQGNIAKIVRYINIFYWFNPLGIDVDVHISNDMCLNLDESQVLFCTLLFTSYDFRACSTFSVVQTQRSFSPAHARVNRTLATRVSFLASLMINVRRSQHRIQDLRRKSAAESRRSQSTSHRCLLASRHRPRSEQVFR